MKKILSILLIAFMIVAMAMPAMVKADGQAGTTLNAYVTATAYWTRTFSWTIENPLTLTIGSFTRRVWNIDIHDYCDKGWEHGCILHKWHGICHEWRKCCY
jgi:hypothetical protein